MPEGPEVYILSKALKDLAFETKSIGKHLLLTDWNNGEKLDYSFGLVGKIFLKDDMSIEKITNPLIPSGNISTFQESKTNLGIDWMMASKEDLEVVVKSWLNRKKQIGALLLDQSEIAGIGVAWASEILFDCKISPTIKANMFTFLNLKDKFLDSLVSVRDKIKKIYCNFLAKSTDKKLFVNQWFNNLYTQREPYMKIFKKGSEVKVSGRIFYE